jgi:hypothetical protein
MTLLEEFSGWEHFNYGFALEALAEAETDSQAWSMFWHPDRMLQLVRHRGIDLDEAKVREWSWDCAEQQTLPIFERAFPNEWHPRHAVLVARRFANGQATRAELDAAVAAVHVSARAAHDCNAGLGAYYALWAAAGWKLGESVVRDPNAQALELEIGFGLIPLVDSDQGGTFLDRIAKMRKQIAQDQGLAVPPIRIRDNLRLPADKYSLRLWGQEVAQGRLTTTASDHLGTQVPDLADVLVAHLAEIVRSHALTLVNPPAGLELVEAKGGLQKPDDFMKMAWSIVQDAAANAAAWEGQGSQDPEVWLAAGHAARAWQADRLRFYFPNPFNP